MDRATAEILIAQYSLFEKWFNEFTVSTISLPDADLAKSVRKSAADMFFIIDDAIRRPVSDQFPDLDPDLSNKP